MADNIRLGRPDATRAEIEAAVHAVRAEPVIDAMPNGLDTEVGERGVLLSACRMVTGLVSCSWCSASLVLSLRGQGQHTTSVTPDAPGFALEVSAV